MAILMFLTTITFLCSAICIIRPIKTIGIPTRKRALVVMGISFVLLVLAGSMMDTNSPDQEKQIANIDVSEAIISDKSREWNVHEFKIINDEDISFGNRLRRSIEILAPSAVTREDRIATLIEAGQQVWQEHKSHYIALFLVAFESGPMIARIDYAPDKCGVSGKNCTGRVWTNAFATDIVFTPREQQIIMAWEIHKNQFKEIDKEFKFETINEHQLIEFLAKRFNTNMEEIDNAMVQSGSSVIQQEIAIPDYLESLGHLNNQEQK